MSGRTTGGPTAKASNIGDAPSAVALITGADDAAARHIAEREAYLGRLLAERWRAAQAGEDETVRKLDVQIADTEHALAWMRGGEVAS